MKGLKIQISYDDPSNKLYDVKKLIDLQSVKDFIDFLTYLPHGSPSQLFKDDQKK